MITDIMIDGALDWSIKTFGDENKDIELRKLEHLKEEVNEIIYAITSGEPKEDLKIEYVDGLILLLTAARKSGFTLEDLKDGWEWKMQIKRKIKWGKPN